MNTKTDNTFLDVTGSATGTAIPATLKVRGLGGVEVVEAVVEDPQGEVSARPSLTTARQDQRGETGRDREAANRRGRGARIHPRRKTPVNATLIVAGIVLLLALVFGLVTLAAWTSAITLVVFALVNLSLWRLKRAPQASDAIWRPSEIRNQNEGFCL